MFKRLIGIWAIVIGSVVGAMAQTTVEFPTLPSGSAWVTGLTSIFIAAAGLGLGILGLRFVISMISAGLARRKAR